MSHSTISFLVLGGIVVLFVWNRFPVEIVAVGAAVTLYATGVLTLQQSLAGFADPAVVFIAALFVVSEGLDASGVTAWAGRELIRSAGGNRTRLIVYTMLLVAVLTAFISVNGAVAALLPVVVVIAVRLNWAPSRLLLPLAFGAHAGSMLALTGTPVSVIVSEAAYEAHTGRFGYFDFALVGIPLVIGAILIVLLFGERLLPERVPRVMPPNFSRHAQTLFDQYLRDHARTPETLFGEEKGVVEVVVAPRSGLVGATVFSGMVTESGTLVVLAIQRRGEDLGTGEVELAAGDTLLLQGSWEAFEQNLDDPDVLVVDAPDLVRRQVTPIGTRGKVAVGILAAMVVLLATGITEPVVAGLLAAGAMILLRVVTMPQAYRAISWTTVILVAGMIPLSTAMQESGAAEKLAHGLVDLVGSSSPYLLVFGLCLLTAVFGQLISNMATALIVIPIAVSAAADASVSAKPLLMAVNVAAAASFLTPVATPVNLMVKEPGGYRFGDYWKLGLPFMALFLLVATFLVPVFWKF